MFLQINFIIIFSIQKGCPSKEETNEIVEIKGFTDRVYAKAPNEIKLHGAGGSKTLKLSKSNGLADWVVWNPYETAAKMADMHEDVCTVLHITKNFFEKFIQ